MNQIVMNAPEFVAAFPADVARRSNGTTCKTSIDFPQRFSQMKFKFLESIRLFFRIVARLLSARQTQIALHRDTR